MYDTARRCVVVSIEIPAMPSHDTTANIATVRIAGQPLLEPPIPMRVCRGIMTQIVIPCVSCAFFTTPCISPEGRLYCPPGNDNASDVFDSDGTHLPAVPGTSLGLSKETRWAHAAGIIPSLIVAGMNGRSSRLVAVASGRSGSLSIWGVVEGDYHSRSGPVV